MPSRLVRYGEIEKPLASLLAKADFHLVLPFVFSKFINWAQNRFLVHSPKTEHHEGKSERVVPLFPELRAELDRHFLSDETEGNEFVIQGYQGKKWDLYYQFDKIKKLAGLETLISPFVNMRRSRSNEVRRRWGQVLESLWIGHSERVAKEHYALVSDEEFAEAAEENLDRRTHVKSHVIGCPVVSDTVDFH